MTWRNRFAPCLVLRLFGLLMPPAFSSPTFVTREKLVSIDQQFLVDDASGHALLHVRRPIHGARSLIALVAAVLVFLAAGVGVGAASLSLEGYLPASLRPAVVPVGVLAAVAATVVTYARLNPAWELIVTAADDTATPLLCVQRRPSLWPFRGWFDVRSSEGEVLGSIRSRRLWTCWYAWDATGSQVVRAWRPIVPRRLSEWFRRGATASRGD